MLGELVEVLLQGGTALLDELLLLHYLALDHALVGAERNYKAAIGFGDAVGEGDEVAKAAADAELLGRGGEISGWCSSGDEIGDEGAGAGDEGGSRIRLFLGI